MPAKLISTREVSAHYGLSDKTIRRLLKDGTLTGYRVGKRLIKLDPEQVEAVLVHPVNEAVPNNIESAVAKVLEDWPPLTATQRDRIAAILRAGSGDAA